MSQDFVRRMPSAGFGQTRTVGLGEKFHLDIPIILLLVMICAYGLLILYSAVGQQTAPVVNQLIKIGVAFGLMIVMAQISPIFYLRIAPWLFVVGIVLLIAVLFVGTTVNGSQRWLRIPGVLNFQPSELMKLVIPMMLASYFHDRHLPPLRRHVFWACVMIFIPVLLIARQPDLGTSLLIGASGLLVLLLAGISWRYVFSAVLAGLMAAPILTVQIGMGETILILAFVVIVIGGIGSIQGAFVAAILVGLIDTVGRAFLADLLHLFLTNQVAETAGPAISSMLIYIVMAAVLAIRPQGLFPPRGH